MNLRRDYARPAQPLSLKTSARPIASQAAEAICYISRKISCRNSRVVPADPGSRKSRKGEYFTKHRPRCLPPSF